MTCPICGSGFATVQPDKVGRDVIVVNCSFCGDFSLSGTMMASLSSWLQQRDASIKLSHAARKAYELGSHLLVDTYTAEVVLKNPLPRPREQADLLISWLARNVPGPGERVKIDYDMHGAVIGAKSYEGFNLVVDHLIEARLINGSHVKYVSGESRADVTLTFSGWDRYETLRVGGVTYRKAFMAMKFGDDELDMVLNSIFKPSALRAGFDLFKMDDRPIAGLIDDRMRVEIRACDFLIADLTHDNAGAYWEAGFAEGLGKPVIYTCERTKFEKKRTHFDTNHHLTVVWDVANLEMAGMRLTETIRATLPHLAKMTDNA